MTDNQQTFTLLDPSGVPIMKGSMPALMEHIPDSVARNRALDDVVRIACDAVEAEERANEARACAIKHFCDGITRLAARIDQFEKARALSAKRAEAQRKARDAEKVQRYMDEQWHDPDEPDEPDELYSIDPKERETSDQDIEGIPTPADPAGAALKTGDDGDLEIKHAPDPEPDTHPGWFTGNVRASQGPIGMDPPGWRDAYRSWATQQGYLG
jgi:hypothetical protein